MSIFRKCSGFFDLNLNIDSKEGFIEKCNKLIELNYDVIAVNQIIQVKKEDKKVPPPMKITLDLPEHIKKGLQILNRLTIKSSDPTCLQRLAQSNNFKKYHLIALIPQNEAIFQQACTSKLVDIISVCVHENDILFLVNRKLYNLALDQNIYFELSYVHAIRRPRTVIWSAFSYHKSGKSKNIIVTSAARSSDQLQGPYNVIALGLILELSEEQSKNAITNNCKNLLLHAEARRFRKVAPTTVGDMDLDSESEENSDGDSEPKAKNHIDIRHSAVSDTKSDLHNLQKTMCDMERSGASEDDIPKPKRHCVDPHIKTSVINKDVET